MKKALTVQEVSEFLSCAPRQVHYWIATGELVAIDVSKTKSGLRPRWRIAESDLAEFIETRKNPAAISRQTPVIPHKPKRPVLKSYV